MDKFLKKIIDIVFILIIILLIGYFALRYYGIIEIFRVETGSMEDGIHPGDYVLIVKKSHYDVGDVVTYVRDNYYVTHRIVKEIDDGLVITKGDANNTEDGEISRTSIVGKVILVGGILNIVINYKYSIVGLFLVLYLISCYINSDKKEIEQEETDNKPIEEYSKEQESEEANLEEIDKKDDNKNEEVNLEQNSEEGKQDSAYFSEEEEKQNEEIKTEEKVEKKKNK